LALQVLLRAEHWLASLVLVPQAKGRLHGAQNVDVVGRLQEQGQHGRHLVVMVQNGNFLVLTHHPKLSFQTAASYKEYEYEQTESQIFKGFLKIKSIIGTFILTTKAKIYNFGFTCNIVFEIKGNVLEVARVIVPIFFVDVQFLRSF